MFFKMRLDHHLRNVRGYLFSLFPLPMAIHDNHDYMVWRQNSTTAEEVASFQRLFPNPS